MSLSAQQALYEAEQLLARSSYGGGKSKKRSSSRRRNKHNRRHAEEDDYADMFMQPETNELLDSLPNDLLYQSLTYLWRRDMLHVSLVCKELHNVVAEVAVSLFIEYFGAPHPLHMTKPSIFSMVEKIRVQTPENFEGILLWASFQGYHEVVDRLTGSVPKNRLNVRRPLDGSTPLMLACANNHLQSARLLVERGCKVSKCSTSGWNALHVVSKEGHTEVAKYLIDETDCPVDEPNKAGMTPLHIAASHGNVDIMRMLIHARAPSTEMDIDDPNYGDAKAQRALEAARAEYLQEAANVLTPTDAPGQRADTGGESALHIAARQGHADVVEFLVDEMNADLECHTSSGDTPLIIAAEEGHGDVIDFLLSRDVDVTATTNAGKSALYVACEQGQIDVIQMLVDGGCIVNQPTMRNKIAIYCAAEQGNKEIVKILLQYSTKKDLFAETTYGTTPLFIAQKAGFGSIKDMMVSFCEEWDKKSGKRVAGRRVSASLAVRPTTPRFSHDLDYDDDINRKRRGDVKERKVWTEEAARNLGTTYKRSRNRNSDSNGDLASTSSSTGSNGDADTAGDARGAAAAAAASASASSGGPVLAPRDQNRVRPGAGMTGASSVAQAAAIRIRNAQAAAEKQSKEAARERARRDAQRAAEEAELEEGSGDKAWKKRVGGRGKGAAQTESRFVATIRQKVREGKQALVASEDVRKSAAFRQKQEELAVRALERRQQREKERLEKETAKRREQEENEATRNRKKDEEWRKKKERALVFRKARVAASDGGEMVASTTSTVPKKAPTSQERPSLTSPKAAGSGAAAVSLMNRSRSADSAVSATSTSASRAANALLDISDAHEMPSAEDWSNATPRLAIHARREDENRNAGNGVGKGEGPPPLASDASDNASASTANADVSSTKAKAKENSSSNKVKASEFFDRHESWKKKRDEKVKKARELQERKVQEALARKGLLEESTGQMGLAIGGKAL